MKKLNLKTEKNGNITTGIKSKAKKVGRFLYERKDTIAAVMLFLIIATPSLVFADETPTTSSSAGDEQWNFLITLIVKWGKRIGGAMFVIGGVEFGLGWKDERPDQRTQGLRIFIAGGIVLGVFAASGTFIK